MRGTVFRSGSAGAVPLARLLWPMCAILLLAPAASAVPIIDWEILGSDAQRAEYLIPVSKVDVSTVDRQPGPVRFRLYGYDDSSPGDDSGIGSHPGAAPLSRTGTKLSVVGRLVPEPVVLAPVGLGLAMLTFAGRRRPARR